MRTPGNDTDVTTRPGRTNPKDPEIFLEGIREFFETLEGGWGYLFLFVSCLGENLFPPLPGDTFMVLGAFLVGRGQLAFLPAYIAATAGSLLGFMVLFIVGRFFGARFLRRTPRLFSAERIVRVEAWFARYGYGVIAFNRFLSGFRGVVSIVAGLTGLDPKRTFVLAAVSCCIWNALLMSAGVLIGDHWEHILDQYQRIAFGLIAILLAGLWIRYVIRRRKRQR